MSDIDIDAIRARAEAATPGPWVLRHDEPSMSGQHWTIRRHGVPVPQADAAQAERMRRLWAERFPEVNA